MSGISTPDIYGDRDCMSRWNHRDSPETYTDDLGNMFCLLCYPQYGDTPEAEPNYQEPVVTDPPVEPTPNDPAVTDPPPAT